mmetsp:Transcript_12724/g.38185  ORF Transcript_12724/g.38185 Transcript_12724/m.38185 type:complete len:215 (+) Transcript_12724:207-851(+)
MPLATICGSPACNASAASTSARSRGSNAAAAGCRPSTPSAHTASATTPASPGCARSADARATTPPLVAARATLSITPKLRLRSSLQNLRAASASEPWRPMARMTPGMAPPWPAIIFCISLPKTIFMTTSAAVTAVSLSSSSSSATASPRFIAAGAASPSSALGLGLPLSSGLGFGVGVGSAPGLASLIVGKGSGLKLGSRVSASAGGECVFLEG